MVIIINRRVVARLGNRYEGLLISFARAFLLLYVRSNAEAGGFFVVFVRRVVLFNDRLGLSDLFLDVGDDRSLVRLLVRRGVVAIFERRQDGLYFRHRRFIVNVDFYRDGRRATRADRGLPTVVRYRGHVLGAQFLQILCGNFSFPVLLLGTFRRDQLVVFRLSAIGIQYSVENLGL